MKKRSPVNARADATGAPVPVRGQEMTAFEKVQLANNPSAGDTVWHFFSIGGQMYYELLQHDGGPRMPAHDETRPAKTLAKTTHQEIAQTLIEQRQAELYQPRGGVR